jgi:hypothetical protein
LIEAALDNLNAHNAAGDILLGHHDPRDIVLILIVFAD